MPPPPPPLPPLPPPPPPPPTAEPATAEPNQHVAAGNELPSELRAEMLEVRGQR